MVHRWYGKPYRLGKGEQIAKHEANDDVHLIKPSIRENHATASPGPDPQGGQARRPRMNHVVLILQPPRDKQKFAARHFADEDMQPLTQKPPQPQVSQTASYLEYSQLSAFL